MEDRNRLIDFARLSLFKSNNDKTYSSKLTETASLALPRHTQAKGMGSMELTKLKGNTVVWNQLVNPIQGSGSLSGVTITKNADGSYTLNGTATANNNYEIFRLPVVSGHRYLLVSHSAVVTATSWNNPMVLSIPNSIHSIGTATANGTTIIYLDINNGTTYNNVVVRPQLVDLTQMFGAGNEPSTYEEFLSRKPLVGDEFAYNEGEIVSVANPIIKTTGRNLWDEEWEQGYYDGNGTKVYPEQSSSARNRICSKGKIKVLPNKSYYCHNGGNGIGNTYICEYNSNGDFIAQNQHGNAMFVTSSNTAYITICTNDDYGTTYNHDICINVSDPAFNGQYEPYISHTLPIDTEIGKDGFNLWDEEWEVGDIGYGDGEFIDATNRIRVKNYISVIGGATYYFHTPNPIEVLVYDSNHTYLGNIIGYGRFRPNNSSVTLPNNAAYIRAEFTPTYGTTYKHDICINESDPAYNGMYAPYGQRVQFFPLGLNGINGVHDELTPTKAVKRFGVKVLDGTENWAYDWAPYGGIVDIAESILDGANGNNIIMSHYTNIGNASPSMADNSFGRASGLLFIRDNTHVTSFASWKSHLADLYAQGKPLTVVYELANPIEVAVESGLSLPYQQGGLETLEGISAIPSGDVTYYHDVQYNHWSLAAKTFVGNLIADTIKAAGKLLKIESEVQVKALRIGKARISWDESAEAIKVDGSMYTTGFSSAGGVNPSGASGNVSVLAKMLTFTQSDFDPSWGMYRKTITNDLHNALLITQCTRTDGEVVLTDVRVTSESIDIMVDMEGEYKFIAMGTQS